MGGGGVSLVNSTDTNASLEVSSRIGFKSTWEKQGWGTKAWNKSPENCESGREYVLEEYIFTGKVGFPVSSSRSLSIWWISISCSDWGSTYQITGTWGGTFSWRETTPICNRCWSLSTCWGICFVWATNALGTSGWWETSWVYFLFGWGLASWTCVRS